MGIKSVNSLNMLQAYGEDLVKDDLGIQPPAQCSNCRNCVRCLKQDLELSKQDREVLAKVRDSLKVVETEAGPQVLMSYPLNGKTSI